MYLKWHILISAVFVVNCRAERTNKRNNDSVGYDSSDLLLIWFGENPVAEHLPRYEGKKIYGAPTEAEIIRLRKTVMLKCNGGVSQKITWMFYPCPKDGHNIKKLCLSPKTIQKKGHYYDIISGRTSGKVTSSLLIKMVTEKEVAGLYRCDITSDAESETHYFIVGRKGALKECLPGTEIEDSNALLKTIQTFIRTAEQVSSTTYEYILKLPFGKTRTHDYRIRFSTFGNGGWAPIRETGEWEKCPENFNLIKLGVSDVILKPFGIGNFIRENLG